MKLTGLERICALVSDDFGERWNFICGGIKTVKVEEDTVECRNCEKEYTDSDAEDFEKFCCSSCESEYRTDIDDDEQAEYDLACKESLEEELAIEEHREEKEESK